MGTKPPRTHLKERAEIQRKTETKEFISGIFVCRCELAEVKRAGNAGHTVTLAVGRKFHSRHGAGHYITVRREKRENNM